MGGDTPFRWDFLARQLLAYGKFDFYPPLTPADFRTYFFVDGIPPLVSFTHWWLYASAGRHLPALTSVFVAAQFVCTLAFTYGAASAVFSRRAGVLAAAILAASPLYFRSVVQGQETGLTALSIAATIYFVVIARQPDDLPAMVSAGLAAALCALSREYGWIARDRGRYRAPLETPPPETGDRLRRRCGRGRGTMVCPQLDAYGQSVLQPQTPQFRRESRPRQHHAILQRLARRSTLDRQ